MQAEIRIEIPPQPEVLINLSRETGKENPSIKVITSILEKDVGLAGGILGLANSPMFSGSGKFSGLNEAVIYLGLNTIASFATAVVIKKALGANKANLQFFWDKSNAIADECAGVASHQFFKSLRVSQSSIFTACLLRDCGQAILVMNFPEYELKIGEDKYGLCSVLKDAEDEKFGISHSRIGHMLCHYWGIPEVVCEAIRDHDKVDAYELPSTSEKLAYMSIGHLGHIRYMKKKGIYNQELDHIFRAIKQVYELDETTVNEIFDIELQA